MLLPYAVAALFSATRSHRGWLWGGILAGVGLTMAPLLGIAYGAVCGAAVAFSYNFVASRWGGIQVTSREVTRPAKRLHARTADASRHADADAAHRQSPPSAP